MDSYTAFYNKFRDRLFSYLMRYTGDCEISGDIMQESFTRYLENYSGQLPRASLLFTIARNVLFDHSRNRSRNVQLGEDPIDRSRSQERDLMIKQEYRQVLEALKRLNQDERDILALAISDGLSYRDVASIVGISVENVKVKVHRARHKLKKILQRGEPS